MTYGAFGRMTGWSGPAGSETHTYRGAGWERTSTTVHPAGGEARMTQFLYDGDDVLADYVGGAVSRQYLGVGLDRALGFADFTGGAASLHYYLHDGLGSVTGLTDAAGSLTTRYHTTAFGEPYSPPGANAGAGTPLIPDQRYGFTGRENTLSGMMYYRNRNYSPSLGRFTSPDPIGYEGGLNLYNYCGSDPVNRWDPMGLDWQFYYAEDGSVAYRWFDNDTRAPKPVGGPSAEEIEYATAQLAARKAQGIVGPTFDLLSVLTIGPNLSKGPLTLNALEMPWQVGHEMGYIRENGRYYRATGRQGSGYIFDGASEASIADYMLIHLEGYAGWLYAEPKFTFWGTLKRDVNLVLTATGNELKQDTVLIGAVAQWMVETEEGQATWAKIKQQGPKYAAVAVAAGYVLYRSGLLAKGLNKLRGAMDDMAAGAGSNAVAHLGRDQIMRGVGDAMSPFARQIRAAIPDVSAVGYRGSLARGFKGPHKGGVPFDPDDFDVDAFIVSDSLAEAMGRRGGFRSGASIQGLEAFQEEIDALLRRQFPGLRQEKFNFRIYSEKEFRSKVMTDAYVLID